MKTVGIICEYNPFHLGHLRQIRMIREKFGEDTAIICVMSGNYVQRGEPAMWDKFTRADAAVSNGVDLVLELPVTKVLQSAEGFARGGVELLTKLGIVDTLCFGSECGNTEKLLDTAHKLNAQNELFKNALSQGLSYAAAKQSVLEDDDGILSKPNNILAVEYCRALMHYNSSMVPVTIQRNGDYHALSHETGEPSATAVRSHFPNDDWRSMVPAPTAQKLESAAWYSISAGERAVLARLRALSDNEWENCAHGSEGLWSKAMKASRSEVTVEAIIQKTKSKRYPRTRIQRLLLCAYLGITESDLTSPLSYARILSASETGRSLLRRIKDADALPLVNPGQTPCDTNLYRLETRAADLFTLFCANDLPCCETEQNARLKF